MNTSIAAPATQPAADVLERIVGARGCLVALEEADGDALIGQFRSLVRRTGQAIYLWSPDEGLGNLREEHAEKAPHARLSQVLRYIQQSNHFGIYLLRRLPLPLAAPDVALLRTLARTPTGHVRRVVLLDAPESVVEGLSDVIVRLSCQVKPAHRPRLRDGRWLL